MKIKTSELTGAALDWAVAKIEEIDIGRGYYTNMALRGAYSPSTDWDRGGPIIEREKIELVPSIGGTYWYAESLVGHIRAELCLTPLIAAMRCYVASKLGDEVEVPDELIG